MHHRDHDDPAASAPTSPSSLSSSFPSARSDGAPDLGTVHPRLWRDVLDCAPGFWLLLNADHVCVYASPGVRGVFRRPPEALIGTRPESHLDPDQLPPVWRARAAVAAGARNVPARMCWRDKSGREHWFDTSSTSVRDPIMGVTYTAVRGWSVSHEIEFQSALARSEQRHAVLLDVVEQAVLQLDAALRIESFNRQALSLLEHTPDRLLGRPGLIAVDLRDGDGRVVPGIGHAVFAPTAPGQEEPWCTVTTAGGTRALVRARLSTFAGVRPQDVGHLLVLRTAPSGASRPDQAPTREQARAAAGLTAREGDVLDGLAAGGDVPTIARWLGISVHSVRGHVKSITSKLGVHSQLQAVIAAARRGMVDLSETPPTPR